MKIYLTFYEVRYEGSTFLGAYSSKDSALKAIEHSVTQLDYSKRFTFDSEYMCWSYSDQSYYVVEEELLD